MYREERTGKLITFLAGATLTILVALIAVFKIGFVFGTNDDATLRNIASGAFTGNPDAHLIYIMYPLGLIFKGLYTVASKVSWYDYVMVGLHFGCLFLILIRIGYYVKNNLNRIISLLGTTLLFVAIELKFMAVHQYTELAGLICATALLYLGTHNYKKKTKADVVLVIVLLLLALWLRKQVLFLCLPFGILLLLLSIFETTDTMDDRFERFKSMIIPVVITVVLFAASFAIEAAAYSSDEWKAFKAFNEARTDVYDYNMLPDYYSNMDFYGSIGVSEEEYTVLREYGLLMLDDMDTDTLNAIADRAAEVAKEWAQYYSVPRKIINDTVEAFLNLFSMPVVAVGLVSFVAMIIVSLWFDDRITALVILASAVYSIAFVGFFTYKNRLPERVSHAFFLMGLFFSAAVFMRLIMKQRNLKARDPFWEIVSAIAFLIVVGMMGLYAYRQGVDGVQEKMVATKEWIDLNKYFKENQDKVFVINNSVFAASGDVVFADKTTDSYNVITGNWTLGGPLYEERNSRLLTDSVYKELADNENVLYVQPAGKNIEWLTEFFGNATVIETVTVSDGTCYDIISVSR